MRLLTRPALAIAAMFAASTAFAQSENFAGAWRIVRMERASWLPEAKPPGELLRTGIVIGEGEIIAPPALACRKGVFKEEQLSQSAAFGREGKLSAPQRYLQPFGHVEGGVMTLHASCGDKTFDYHRGTFGELYLLHQNHVLMLRKEGAGGEGKSAGIEARNASFDCAKAKSRFERLICEWPDALMADGDMGMEFRRLQKELSKAKADSLLSSQRAFNAYVGKICEVGNVLHYSGHNLETTAKCVAAATRARADFLAALAVASAGPLRIEPSITTQTRITGRENDMSGWRTDDAIPVLIGAAKPVADGFAAQVRRAFRTDKRLIGDRLDLNGAVTRTYRIATLSESFVSLSAVEHVDAGTSVPDHEVAINLDLKTGKPVTLRDVFDMSEGWASAVSEALKKDLNQPERFEEFRKDILTGGDDILWIFGADKITVSWRVEGMGPAESVDISARLVAPFVKDTSPWRP